VTDTATVADSAPVAQGDAYTTAQGTPLSVAVAQGVLANDSDVDGDALTAQLVSGPAHGSLALNGDGSFTYTPDAPYSGPDSFTYKANDGQLDSNVATVTLTVQATAPVVLDNGQPGYSDAGSWYDSTLGYGGSLRFAAAG